DLARADPFAARLDHLIAAADEIVEAVGVTAEGVAGEQHLLPRHGAVAEGARRRLGLAPITGHDVGAAHDEFTFAGALDGRAGVVYEIKLAVRHALADRTGTDVDLVRRQVGGALALRQTVHREDG